jgi:hypothetical protein
MMLEKRTVERARKVNHEGKAPTTQAGEFVREEMHPSSQPPGNGSVAAEPGLTVLATELVHPRTPGSRRQAFSP